MEPGLLWEGVTAGMALVLSHLLRGAVVATDDSPSPETLLVLYERGWAAQTTNSTWVITPAGREAAHAMFDALLLEREWVPGSVPSASFVLGFLDELGEWIEQAHAVFMHNNKALRSGDEMQEVPQPPEWGPTHD